MEDSFKVRVEKLFGAHLFEKVPKSSFPTSSWSVTDGEVERRMWNRERGVDHGRDDVPCASSYDEDEDGCFARKSRDGRRRMKKMLEDDRDDLEDEGEEVRRSVLDEEEMGIRASIGLDSTLDREDEEDENDMAAVFKEERNDRVYMSDVTDCGPYVNYHSVVLEDPNDVNHQFDKDPRADHLAANARLREDDKGCENSHPVAGDVDTLMVHCQSRSSATADANLKPILKRKENHEDLRPRKHVRFDSSSGGDRNNGIQSAEVVKAMVTSAATVSDAGSQTENSPGIPDYIRNPSKYVYYSFDASDDVDNKSNLRAFEDLQNMKKTKPKELEAGSMELPKSVSFTPRRKTTDVMVTDSGPSVGNENANRISQSEVVRSIGIAAGDAQESESCSMEEDNVVEEKCGVLRKAERKYRSRSSSDESAF